MSEYSITGHFGIADFKYQNRFQPRDSCVRGPGIESRWLVYVGRRIKWGLSCNNLFELSHQFFLQFFVKTSPNFSDVYKLSFMIYPCQRGAKCFWGVGI